jgi:hypothetical protein
MRHDIKGKSVHTLDVGGEGQGEVVARIVELCGYLLP